METTAFANGGRSSLQNFRRLLARAVSESRGNTAKVNWLSALIAVAVIDVTADEPLSRASTDTDSKSNNTRPDFVAALTRACSEASIYGGDYKTQVIADLNLADGVLTA
mgnify:FL=1